MSKARLSRLPDRGVLAIRGKDRIEFLQGLVTQDVTALAPDHALYAGLLSPQGKLICDFFLAATDDAVLLDVAADRAASLTQRLTLYKLRAVVEIENASASLGVAALFGDGACEKLGLSLAEGAARAERGGALFTDPRLAALGVRLILPREATIDADPATPKDYATHRLALGIGEGGEIGNESLYPLEANFEALHGVDFRKGCYVGQELTARMKHRGGLRKRVLPIQSGAALPVPGTAVEAEGKEIGTLLAAQGTQGLALFRLDRLSEAQNVPLLAQGVSISVSWPAWLPR